MKLYTYLVTLRPRKREKRIPNAEPFLLWTAESQTWRPIQRKTVKETQ